MQDCEGALAHRSVQHLIATCSETTATPFVFTSGTSWKHGAPTGTVAHDLLELIEALE